MKARFFAAVAAGLILTCTMTEAFAIENGYVPQPVYNAKGEVVGTTRIGFDARSTDVFDSGEADVTGDGVKDTVYMTGTQTGASPYIQDIQLVVKDGATGQTITGGIADFAGYYPRLFLGDFNGDKVADAYVEAASGGSGGWYHHQIVSFKNDQTNLLFSDKFNREPLVSGKFVDGYKAEINYSNQSIILDVSKRKADYLRLGLYADTGIVQKEAKLMVSPYGSLIPVDIDNDGTYELQGAQRISGAYNADGLATVEATIKYNGTDAWLPYKIKLSIPLFMQ